MAEPSREGVQVSSTSQSAGNVDSPARPIEWRDRLLPAALAAALGLVLVYGAGFAETEALHNAAHDVRHSAAMPCH